LLSFDRESWRATNDMTTDRSSKSFFLGSLGALRE
jgi:hypothetical protein